MTLSKRERSRLASEVIALARGLDEVRGLDMGELDALSTEELLDYAESHGVALNLDRMLTLVREQLGADLDALDSGVVFLPAKQERFETDIDAAVTTMARLDAKDVMRSFRAQVLSEADERPSEDRYMIWVSKLRRPCRDCEERHGQILSDMQWDDVGKPGAGSTICGARCECDLVPVAVTRDESQKRIDEVNAQGPRRRAA